MATPLSAAQFLAALKAEGVRVVEVGDWRHHNRNAKGPWGPVNGVMIHHTVTSGTKPSVDICRNGYSSLPGPLCHGVIDKDGGVHLVGYGRANHAGGGDPAVLRHVTAEDYGTRPPSPSRGNANGIDGNARFYGFECINLGNGRDPWPEAQLEAIERVGAAICRAHEWGARSVIGHLEWSADKIDPRGFGMPGMRDRIAARLKTKPGSGGSTSTYTVGRGDTLWSIAASKLGDGNRYREIAKLNGLKDADAITPGQKLKLPKK
ncbi:peptidoglycan recognition protein family protein [Streptomyces hygroscopicus]|uniref:peptidoglycan recognition protein family protein n=1 Tax=Streptomyces hygroscopicus TaxID=1912 RepID=UPI00367AA8A0